VSRGQLLILFAVLAAVAIVKSGVFASGEDDWSAATNLESGALGSLP
jgi:cytochrome b